MTILLKRGCLEASTWLRTIAPFASRRGRRFITSGLIISLLALTAAATRSQAPAGNAETNASPRAPGRMHHPKCTAIVGTPDGKLWITAAEDIRFWDARTLNHVRTIRPDEWQEKGVIPRWLRLSEDGSTLVALTLLGNKTGGGVLGFGVATGKQIFEIQPPGRTQFSGFAISPDGKIVATGTCNNEIILWDALARKELRTIEGDRRLLRQMEADGRALKGLKQPVGAIVFSPYGDLLAAVSLYDWTVRVYDLNTGKETHAFPTNNPSYCSHVLFSPDGESLAMSRFTGPGFREGKEVITVWNLATSTKELEFEEPAFMGMVASSDWKWMAAEGAGTVHVWDFATGRRRTVLDTKSRIGYRTYAFSGDGNTLAGIGASLNLWDLTTGRVIFTMPRE
jgi:WD40 repeat protein